MQAQRTIWRSYLKQRRAGFSGCIPKKNRTLLTEMSRFCHCKQSAWTMKQGRVSELSKVIVCKSSRELSYETEFDIWAGFGPAGRSKNFCNFASAPLLRVVFFIFSWTKQVQNQSFCTLQQSTFIEMRILYFLL